MIDFVGLKSLFIKWATANAGTTITTIMADQITSDGRTAPRPNKPYVTLKFMSNNALAMEEEIITLDPGIIELKGIREITLSLNSYGSNAQNIIENLRTSLQKYTVRSVFIEAGVSLIEFGTIQNLTELLETKFEERAQFDLRFYVVSSVIDDVNWIETVEPIEADYN